MILDTVAVNLQGHQQNVGFASAAVLLIWSWQALGHAQKGPCIADAAADSSGSAYPNLQNQALEFALGRVSMNDAAANTELGPLTASLADGLVAPVLSSLLVL
jgi:hypothetical protein